LSYDACKHFSYGRTQYLFVPALERGRIFGADLRVELSRLVDIRSMRRATDGRLRVLMSD